MSTTRRSIVLLAVSLVSIAGLLSACGGGEETNGRPTAKATVGIDGGTVALEGGASIEIPPGAVDEDATLTISESDQTPSLPEGLELVGRVWEMGPSGTTFAAPARITLPLPEGQDPGDIVGVVTLQPNDGEWVGVSSSIDAEAGTVSAFIDHLSPFGIVGGRAEAAKTGGWIRVVNPYRTGSQPFPDGKRLPMHKENLVCFTAYSPTNPALLVPPSWDVVVATPYLGTTGGGRPTVVEYWLPAGNYMVEQGIFASEINNSPTYSPEVLWWTRSPQPLVITPGITVTFENYPDVPPAVSTGFAKGPNSCALAWSPLLKSKVTPTVSPTVAPSSTPGATPTVAPSATVVATHVPAKLPAAWIFVCGGNAAAHQLDTLKKNPDGTFSGTGHYTVDPSYTWNINGAVVGSSVTWEITYTGSEGGFVYSGSGTIAGDGSLDSGVDSNVNGCTDVTTSEGVFP